MLRPSALFKMKVNGLKHFTWWMRKGPAPTIEAHGADVGQQLLAVDVGHAGTEARGAGAQLAVHVVQGVGHGVHGVHHELHLPLLLVGGVTAHLLQP